MGIVRILMRAHTKSRYGRFPLVTAHLLRRERKGLSRKFGERFRCRNQLIVAGAVHLNECDLQFGCNVPKNDDMGPQAAFAAVGSSRQSTSSCASSFLLYGALTVVRTRRGLFICVTISLPSQYRIDLGEPTPPNSLRGQLFAFCSV